MIETVLIGMIPAILSGVFLWKIKDEFSKREKKTEKLEEARIKNNELVLRGVSASLALGEATADAIITNSYDGLMEEARLQAKSIKKEIDSFTRNQACVHISK